MLTGTYPGIYLQELDNPVRTITGVPTAIAAFVGPTRTGIDGRAKRILNWNDYERAFGGLSRDSELSYGVLHFFQNGGGEAVVVRVANGASEKSELSAKESGGTRALTVTALTSGSTGDNVYFEIESLPAVNAKTFNLAVIDANTGVREFFSNISTDPSSLRYAKSVVNDVAMGSQLVSVDLVAGKDAPVPTGMTFSGTPASAAFGSKAAKDYSVRASIKRFVVPKDYLAEKDIDIYAKDDLLPASWADLGKKIADAINDEIKSKGKLRVESNYIEFRDANGQVNGRQLRFRIVCADPTTDETPDAVVDIKLGGASGLLALFGLTSASLNASRYRLGFDYAGTAAKATDDHAGVDKGLPTAQDIQAGFAALDKMTFNLLCVPDAVRPKADDPEAALYDNWVDIYSAARKVCEDRRAFLLVDPPPHVNAVNKAEAWKTNELPNLRTAHGAAYFPRLRMTDPLSPGVLRAYPPSGAMAGVMARTDANRGVWKSPAGVDAGINGVFAPAVLMSDEEHGTLNPIGLNCVRQFPIYGSVVFGARTLVGSDAEADQWKYVAVRRTASYILLSLQRGLTWVTFQPNDEPLWAQIRMNVTTFMQGMFRQGAFQGRSPREAYLVKCDAETTLQSDINQGIVNVVVGFAPLKPAEFVFVTLRQLAGQAQT